MVIFFARRGTAALLPGGPPNPSHFRHAGYCEFPYDDDLRFPNGKTVQLRNHTVDSHFGKTTATLDLDIAVTWEPAKP